MIQYFGLKQMFHGTLKSRTRLPAHKEINLHFMPKGVKFENYHTFCGRPTLSIMFCINQAQLLNPILLLPVSSFVF